MKILSLFDGMACGMLAFQSAGVKVDRYVAFEIDKYAIQTSSHNFPVIEHRGDVFHADFTEFSGFDFLVGGSPCTYWSIAQKTNRETEASGMGWELFSQYVRALHEAKPMYFIYENNKSMANAIRESITETFGFEPICINSALVSAQNRQRLYWVGKRNVDGTYSRVHVDQPEDRGILLKDVLDGVGAKELTEREMDYMVRSTNGKYSDRWAYLQKPGENDKALCITANVSKGVPYNICAEPVNITTDGKAWVLKSQYYKNNITNILNDNTQGCRFAASGVAEPGEFSVRKGSEVRVTENNIHGLRKNGATESESFVYFENGKTNALTTGHIPKCITKIADPVRIPEYGIDGKSRCLTASYAHKGPGEGSLVSEAFPDNPNKQVRDYVAESIPVFATPCEWDESGKPTKTVSSTDGKTYTVYEVKDGQITIKGKQYPIKLADGFYIIRKLTVSECKRLQTVPEWYEFPVSDSQAYKMLGNGWTVEVIAHLIKATQANELEEEQINLFEMAR
jgi:DNA (cytosine-5)-methyltransferase 3A